MPHYECDRWRLLPRSSAGRSVALDLRREPRLARADITAWNPTNLHDRQLMAELDADDKCLILAGNWRCLPDHRQPLRHLRDQAERLRGHGRR